MKVLIICDYFPPFSYGGDGVIAKNICEGLKKNGNEVKVITSHQSLTKYKDITPEDEIYRVLIPKEIWHNDISNCNQINDINIINKIFKLYMPDVLLCLHQWGLIPETIRYINRINLPKVYRFGDEWLRLHYNKRSKLNQRLSFNKIVVNSLDLKMKYQILTKSEIHIVRNGVDQNIFKFQPKSKVKHNEVKLLYIGRVVEHKGIINLIYILNRIKNDYNNIFWQLSIVGPFPNLEFKKKIECLISKLNLNNLKIFLGQQPHESLPRIYHSHDIFVFPTQNRESNKTVEGCPNSILEAWATGIPVIANSTKGTNELLKHKQNSLCVESNNEEIFCKNIINLVRDDKLRESIVNQANLDVAKNHNNIEYTNRIESILNSSINEY
jgi:glycosyltransferase involved in cell wall biosynthesis